MSRQLRLEFPGAIWHVTRRGNERRDIYRDEIDRRRFVSLLGRIVIERRWLLHAWVLMSLIRSIVLNPVRCRAVRHPGDYEWSNYRATAGLQVPPPGLEVDWTLGQFGGANHAASCDAYRRFVADARGASYKPWEAIVGQIYLGGAAFCDRMQDLVKTKERSREHPRPQRRFVRPALDTLVAAVADAFNISPDDLRLKSRGHARKALAQLAVDDAGLTLRAVAEWMGVSEWASSKMRRSARELYLHDPIYQERVDRIRAALRLIFQM